MNSGNKTQAGTRLDQIIASGGTNLSSGLFRAISILSTADAEASEQSGQFCRGKADPRMSLLQPQSSRLELPEFLK